MNRAMERIFLVYLSCALMVLWLAGLVTRTNAWMYWSFALAAVVSLAGSFFANRLVTAAVSIGLGAWMTVMWVIALALDNGSWMTFWPAPFALFYFVLGGTSTYLWLHPDHGQAQATTRTSPRSTRPFRPRRY